MGAQLEQFSETHLKVKTTKGRCFIPGFSPQCCKEGMSGLGLGSAASKEVPQGHLLFDGSVSYLHCGELEFVNLLPQPARGLGL